MEIPVALVAERNGAFYALSPTHDICAHGETEKEALERFLMTMVGEHMHRPKEHGDMLSGLPPAPEYVQKVVERFMVEQLQRMIGDQEYDLPFTHDDFRVVTQAQAA